MILVTAATGNIGKYLVAQLAERAIPFRALVRTAAKGEALGCDYVIGDFDDPASIGAAMQGIDRLFLNGDAGPQLVRQMRDVIDAAKAGHVDRIVRISVPGAESGLSVGRQHGEADEYLRGSGIPANLVRPMVFMQNMFFHSDSIRESGRFYGAYGEGLIPFVDCADVAACALALLSGPLNPKWSFDVSGGEALTYASVAAKLSTVLGRQVLYVDLPVAQIVANMKGNGMPAEFAEQLGVMMSLMSKSSGENLTTAVLDLTGLAPRSMEQFFADNRAAFQ